MIFSVPSFAQTTETRFNYGNFKFRLLDAPGECELIGKADGYTASGDLIIPATAQYEGETYSVTSIFTYSFSNASGFTGTLSIPESVKTIWPYAFYLCKNLKGDIIIPPNVTTIGAYAFAYCTGFRGSLILPESLTEIGNHAFDQCRVLSGDLTIPKNVTSIGENAFYQCYGFTGELVLPESITSIGKYAFSECVGFTGIVLPNNLSVIEENVFSDCSGLTGSLIIPENVTAISDNAFSGCSGLAGSLTIPDKVTTIGNNAFKNCISLADTLTLGTSLQKLGIYPFSGCNFSEIQCLGLNPPTCINPGMEMNIFDNFSATLVVPEEATEAYSNSEIWRSFFMVEATGITLNTTEAEIIEGESIQLTPTISPENTTDKSVKWTSADETIAIVDDLGNVSALNAGTTTITATTANGISSSCLLIVEAPPVEAEGITLNVRIAELTEGENIQLTATVYPEDTTDKTVTWISSDNTVATVDETGKVSTQKSGVAKITATTSNGLYASCMIFVNTLVIPVDGVSLNTEDAELVKGKSIQLTATVFPEDATDKSIVWTSDNKTIAKVDDTGKVSALNAGTTNITATTSNGLSASCKITVTVAPNGITLNVEEAELIEDGHIQLTATVSPEDTTDKSVTWTSEDDAIATVDAAGIVTALKIGTTTITATTINGISASCTIMVIVPADGINLNVEDAELTVGESLQLTATVSPDETTDKSVTWTSEDESIATVDATGIVTALKQGTTRITATTNNGFSVSCKITAILLPEEIALNIKEAELTEDETIQLTATISPDVATDKSVTWTSEDETTARVDATGLVTALKSGTTSITATTINGLSASCKIIVTVPADGISLNIDEAGLTIGESLKLTATINPDNTTDKSVVWTSEDEKIATVDATGLVTALQSGTTSITATTVNGLSASCKIIVTIPPDGITLNIEEIELTEGECVQLTATISPEDATDKTVTWTSEDETVATVDADGTVTALNPGSTSVTVTTINGLSASCKITVNALIIPVEHITLNIEEVELTEGESVQLTATIYPEEATYKSVIWTSANEAVATVDASGKVTALISGTTTITATSESGVTASCTISVLSPTANIDHTYPDNKQPFIVHGSTITLNEGTSAIIFNLNGAKVYQSTGGQISGLPHGFYILRTNNTAYKIRL